MAVAHHPSMALLQHLLPWVYHGSKEPREPGRKCAQDRQTQAQTMKDAPSAVKMFTPTKGGWTDLLNFFIQTGKGAAGQLDSGPSPRHPAQEWPCQRGRRDMGPAAAHKGSTHYHSPGGPLGNPQSGKRKPRAKEIWTRPEGVGRWGSRQRAGSEPAVRLCFSRWPKGREWRGCQPRLDVLWSPSQNGFGVPSHQQPGAGGGGERHSLAGSCQGPSLAGRWPSPPKDIRCASTGQLPTLPAWTPSPGTTGEEGGF